MNCPICSNTMVQAQATNFGEHYDYCRVCKKELKEMQTAPPRFTVREETVIIVKNVDPRYLLCLINPNHDTKAHNASPGSTLCGCGEMELVGEHWQRKLAEPELDFMGLQTGTGIVTINKSSSVSISLRHKFDPIMHYCTCGLPGYYCANSPVSAKIWKCAGMP